MTFCKTSLRLSAVLAVIVATVPFAASAQMTAETLSCADFLAMSPGEKNTAAAVVEAALEVQMANVPPTDPADLLALGIDPATVETLPPPMPGETQRVMQEACEAAAGGGVIETLMPPTDAVPAN